MQKLSLALLSLALASLTRVAPAQQVQQLPPAVILDTVPSSVTVQNNRKARVTIYLETGKFDRRLGTVPARSTRTLPLPEWAVKDRATIRLFAHPDDQVDDLSTQTLKLQPPGRVGMLIPETEAQDVAMLDTMTAVIPPEEMEETTITVENRRNVPVTVFAESGPIDVRLGEVQANGRATLRFPKSVVFPSRKLQVFVHPQGGVDMGSEYLDVRPGQHLGLRVPPG